MKTADIARRYIPTKENNTDQCKKENKETINKDDFLMWFWSSLLAAAAMVLIIFMLHMLAT